MAIRIYYNGEELDEIGLVLCGITITATCATLGLVFYSLIWG